MWKIAKPSSYFLLQNWKKEFRGKKNKWSNSLNSLLVRLSICNFVDYFLYLISILIKLKKSLKMAKFINFFIYKCLYIWNETKKKSIIFAIFEGRCMKREFLVTFFIMISKKKKKNIIKIFGSFIHSLLMIYRQIASVGCLFLFFSFLYFCPWPKNMYTQFVICNV